MEVKKRKKKRTIKIDQMCKREGNQSVKKKGEESNSGFGVRLWYAFSPLVPLLLFYTNTASGRLYIYIIFWAGLWASGE